MCIQPINKYMKSYTYIYIYIYIYTAGPLDPEGLCMKSVPPNKHQICVCTCVIHIILMLYVIYVSYIIL